MSRLYLKNIKYLKHNSTIILEIKARLFFISRRQTEKENSRIFSYNVFKEISKTQSVMLNPICNESH